MSAPGLLFSPLAPLWLLVSAIILAALLAAWGWHRGGGRGMMWHLVPALAAVLALANPRLTVVSGTPADDVAVLLVDQSPSMALGDRTEQAERAVAQLAERLGKIDHLQVKLVRHVNLPGKDEGTRLFSTLDAALADIPAGRLAGIVAITDGQVADLPDTGRLGAPLHVLLAGHQGERDRRIRLERPPAFGLVGKAASLTFRIDDPGHGEPALVRMRKDGGEERTMRLSANESHTVQISLDHAGSNVVELEVESVPGELSASNNRTAVAIEGVRDRLRVLLISGEPHVGERTWRNLLKADPSVDLVHFTILRPPNVQDGTPLRDLALIAFPTKELFEDRLRDFDLVILDRYRLRAVLPAVYFRNLADYVRDGGTILLAAGPEAAKPDSPFATVLADIMPALPDGSVGEKIFAPRLSQAGRRHPVTATLPGGEADPPQWGPWARSIGATVRRGSTVLETGEGKPLLVLDRVDKGRVAELLSDQAWLWGRGWRGGGPQAELLRRLAHWLMKEPELEEERLSADIRDGRLVIERTSQGTPGGQVEVTAPDGTKRGLAMSDMGGGRARASTPADQQGLWRADDGTRVAMAALGALDPVEMTDLRATADKVKPIAMSSGGSVRWLDDGMPELRRVRPGAPAAGASWIGLWANGGMTARAIGDVPLMTPLVLLLLGLGGVIWAWWRQGR